MALPLGSPSLVPRTPGGTPSRAAGHPHRTPSYALRSIRPGGGAPRPNASPSSARGEERGDPFDELPVGRARSEDAADEGQRTDEEDREEEDDGGDDDDDDALERAITLVGMGSYQWRLLVLCGFGWLCDNMYLQCIAVILPRVQDHFGTAQSEIGTLTSATMLGMMLGALFWGALADLRGRRAAFRATLGATAVFGLACSWAGSFGSLRLGLFALGFNVGGSMPTDGTILLENLPRNRQYLLTFLSTFFSLGAITSSLMGLLVLPTGSCPEGVLDQDRHDGWCGDVERENWGWRWMLRAQGVLTVGFFLARLLVFRIKEAPRFLAAAGRHAEAVDALRYIASFNGTLTGRVEKEFEAILWNARRVDAVGAPDGYATPSLPRDRLAPPPPLSTSSSSESYAATASSAADGRSTFAFATPTREESQAYLSDLRSSAADAQPSLNLPSNDDPTPSRAAPRRLGSHSPLRAPDQPAASPLSPAHLWQHALESAAEAKDKLLEIFRPEWRRTTVLIWIIWSCLSMAYTMFNAFLPTILEARIDPGEGGGGGGRKEALQEYLAYTVAGAPGSLLGAYLIETTFGRRKTLALTTLVTALAMFLFSAVSSKGGIVVSSMAISLASTAMYAVLYGMTPEVFSTEIRGTACGSAAATSRLAGIVAPLVTGSLLAISPSIPLWTSAAFFLASVGATVLLPFERAEDVARVPEGEYRKLDGR